MRLDFFVLVHGNVQKLFERQETASTNDALA